MSALLFGRPQAADLHRAAMPNASSRAVSVLRAAGKATLVLTLAMLALIGVTLLRVWHFGSPELVSSIGHALLGAIHHGGS